MNQLLDHFSDKNSSFSPFFVRDILPILCVRNLRISRALRLLSPNILSFVKGVVVNAVQLPSTHTLHAISQAAYQDERPTNCSHLSPHYTGLTKQTETESFQKDKPVEQNW
jgi:hypothetical protein